MNYLNLKIELRTFTSASVPCGGILSCINVQQIDNTVFKYVSGYVLTQEEQRHMKPEKHEGRFYLNSVPGLEAALYLHITWYHNCSSEQVDQDEVGDSEAQIFNFFHLSNNFIERYFSYYCSTAVFNS